MSVKCVNCNKLVSYYDGKVTMLPVPERTQSSGMRFY